MNLPFAAVEARAPGKIILAGEHAVVYGRPALAVPVFGVQARVRVTPAPQAWVQAPAVHLDAALADLPATHPLRQAVERTWAALAMPPRPARVHIASTIPVAAGLGSGAAVTVAIVRALAAFAGRVLPPEQVNALAYAVEKLHHGTPSGIDNTVITYGRPLVYRKGAGWELLQVARPVPLVIADTGHPAATRDMVAGVRTRWQAARDRYEALFDAIAEAVAAARHALAVGDLPALGRALCDNQRLLQAIGVSSPALDALVDAALAAGAYGAKLSGAGGGGNMLAVTPPEGQAAVAQALRAAGAARVIVTTLPPTEAA